MTTYKLKKGVSIGSLAAEHDSMLARVFVDTGYLAQLADPNDSVFLLLGRAGSGKTALIKQLLAGYENVVQIDPEELSMQYLQNSVLREIASWGVNLEIFYKYLWRHVCILALARMRYEKASSLPSAIQALAGFRELFFADAQSAKTTRTAAESYIHAYSDQYWVSTDTKIKKITSEMESQLKGDRTLSGHLGTHGAEVSGHLSTKASTRSLDKMEQETVARAQEIVSQFQIADLNKLVDLITNHSFVDAQNPYLLVVDDLDKNWMPDDSLYLELLKSLLLVVRELNYRLKNAKIIVALREDIYQRVYLRTAKHEAQREKWSDVQLKVRWSKEQLVELVDNRLREAFRGQYTQSPPTMSELLPKRGKSTEDDPIDYVLERTLMRPRDVIDFLNRCMANKTEITRLTLADLRAAEIGYSEARLQAVRDEWANCYFGLPATFSLLTRLGTRFKPTDITDDDLLEVCTHDLAEKCPWLATIVAHVGRGVNGISDAKIELLNAWFTTGLVGIKEAHTHRVAFSLDRAFVASKDSEPDRDYITLKMMRSALGVTERAV